MSCYTGTLFIILHPSCLRHVPAHCVTYQDACVCTSGRSLLLWLSLLSPQLIHHLSLLSLVISPYLHVSAIFLHLVSLSLSFSKWPPLPLALVLPLSLLPSLCHLFLTLKSKSDALIRTFRNTLSWNVSPCTSTRPAGPSPLLPVPPVASSAFLSKPFFLSWIKCLKASQGTFICTAQFRHEATQLEIASVKRQ